MQPVHSGLFICISLQLPSTSKCLFWMRPTRCLVEGSRTRSMRFSRNWQAAHRWELLIFSVIYQRRCQVCVKAEFRVVQGSLSSHLQWWSGTECSLVEKLSALHCSWAQVLDSQLIGGIHPFVFQCLDWLYWSVFCFHYGFNLFLVRFQVVLLSATMPADVLEVTKKFMREPIRILVKKEELTLEGIRQFYINVEKEVKKRFISFRQHSKKMREKC